MRINPSYLIIVAAIPALGLNMWGGLDPEAHAACMAIPVLGWLLRIYSFVGCGVIGVLVVLALCSGIFALLALLMRQPPKAERNIHGDWFLPEASITAIRSRGTLRLSLRHGDHGCGLMLIPTANEEVPFALRCAPDQDPDPEIHSWFVRKLGLDAPTITIERDPDAGESCRIVTWAMTEAHTP
jgi:hypothetical protein